jgi:uncharacterized SAM-binding protein YcdF (DUF218 family)
MQTLEHLLSPIGLIWVVLLWGSGTLWRRRQRLLGMAVFGLAGAWWLVGASPFPAWLLAGLERPYVGRSQSPPAADAVVMLGGTHGYTSRGLLPMNFSESADRVTTAVELMRLGRARTLVLGGGYYRYHGVRRPDSELLEVWLRGWKLPVGELVTLGICANTREEATKVGALARARGWQRILLVTTAGHLRRAEGVFRREGLSVIPVGCDFVGTDAMDESRTQWRLVPESQGFVWIQAWLHEELGWWWYRLKGWI